MPTPSVKGKSAASKHQPNLLDQIGKAWNDMMGGKKAAAPRAPTKTQAPKPRPTPVKTAPNTAPTAKKDAGQTNANRRDAVRPPDSGKRSTAPNRPARNAALKPTTQAASTRNPVPGKAPVQKPAAKAVYGPAAPSLAVAEKRISDYARSYDKEATGKSRLTNYSVQRGKCETAWMRKASPDERSNSAMIAASSAGSGATACTRCPECSTRRAAG